MRAISLRSWLLIAASALLQVFSFPTSGPLTLWRSALSWIALTPLLLALLEKTQTGRHLSVAQGALLGYACGMLWYLGNCSWIYQTMYLYGGMAKPVAFVILVLFSLYLGLYHALFGALVRATRSQVAMLWLSPFLWVAVELARARITAFPWDLLGYTQIDNSLLTRLAPLGGVMAMSFVIAAVNLIFVASAQLPGKRRLAALACCFVIAAALQAGSLFSTSVPDTRHQVVLLQENLSVGATAAMDRPLGLAEELSTFSQLSLHPQTNGTPESSGKPDLILWPEAPSHLLSVEPSFLAAMRTLAGTVAAPLIVGSLGIDFDPSSPHGRYVYDSAVVFNQAGDNLGRYDKIHLVPWGEYIPYKDVFAFAQKLTEGAGDMDRGKKRSVFSLDGHTYGVFVCYESIFGDEVREFVQNGAEVLVNISDDGWYGDTGAPWQHLNMARMRAIENHRWVLRDTNTGETTVIDPAGRYTPTQRHVRTAYRLPFDFAQDTTFYTRHGDWFAWLCVLVSVGGLAYTTLSARSAASRS